MASARFANTPRLSRFLRYTVEKALAGEAGQIREYTIALEVYDRGSSFDPLADSIVRVEASRLRSRLREYYETGGKDEPIRIEYPKGSYVPKFIPAPNSAGPLEAGSPEAIGPPVRSTKSRRVRLSLAVAGVVVAAAALWNVGSVRPRISSAPRRSIAVMAFTDLSQSKDQEYFCDGLSEEIIDELSRIEGLRIVARTSAFQYKNKPLDVRKIGAELNVETILEGSVRKSGSQLRITAQLVDVNTGYHLWSNKYDREGKDILALQGEISQAVGEAL